MSFVACPYHKWDLSCSEIKLEMGRCPQLPVLATLSAQRRSPKATAAWHGGRAQQPGVGARCSMAARAASACLFRHTSMARIYGIGKQAGVYAQLSFSSPDPKAWAELAAAPLEEEEAAAEASAVASPGVGCTGRLGCTGSLGWIRSCRTSAGQNRAAEELQEAGWQAAAGRQSLAMHCIWRMSRAQRRAPPSRGGR